MTAPDSRAIIIANFRDRIAAGRRTKLFSVEFDELIADCIQRMAKAQSLMQLQMIAKEEIALLEEGYPQRTLASDYIPRYRKAIEVAIENQTLKPEGEFLHQYTHQQRFTGTVEQRSEHWALTYFKYDKDTYEGLDPRQTMKQTTTAAKIQGVNPQAYLNEIEALLNDTGESKVRKWTIAIAAITGRRIAEMLTPGSFRKTQHPYLLRFQGVPRRDGVEFEIVTLIPAQEVLTVINQWRNDEQIKALIGLQGDEFKQILNVFNNQLNRLCNKNLGPVVPVLEGRKAVAVRDLRALWGMLAIAKFSPTEQAELFVNQYVVPVLGQKVVVDGGPFNLIDTNGQPMQLGQMVQVEIPPLPLAEIEEMPPDEYTEPPMEEPIAAAEELPPNLKDDLVQLFDQKLEAVRSEFVEQLLAIRDQLRSEFAQTSAPQQDQESVELVQRIQQLETENQELVADCDRLKAQNEQLQGQVQQRQEENQALNAKLQEELAKLNQFRALLLGDEAIEESPNEDDEVATDGDQQEIEPTVQPPQKITEPQPTQQQPPQRQQRRRRGNARERALSIFEALQAWNELHPEGTLVLNRGLLETQFRIHRQAAQDFCDEFDEQIKAHHQTLAVSSIHAHNRGKDIQGFVDFVASRLDKE